MVDVCIFPTSLKLANITSMYRKGSKNSKKNYRLVNTLLNISKIYKRCFLSQYQIILKISFQNFNVALGKVSVHSIAWYLWLIIEKKFVDKGKTFAAFLTDLSKAFDCLLHDLNFVKFNAYGFSLSAARLIKSYFSIESKEQS